MKETILLQHDLQCEVNDVREQRHLWRWMNRWWLREGCSFVQREDVQFLLEIPEVSLFCSAFVSLHLTLKQRDFTLSWRKGRFLWRDVSPKRLENRSENLLQFIIFCLSFLWSRPKKTKKTRWWSSKGSVTSRKWSTLSLQDCRVDGKTDTVLLMKMMIVVKMYCFLKTVKTMNTSVVDYKHVNRMNWCLA